MKTVPCKDCTEREPGCHGRCAGYKRWKLENDEAREKRIEDMQNRYTIAGSNYNRSRTALRDRDGNVKRTS